MSTQSAKPGTVERRWYIVDAEGQNLGRLASVIAETLSGKRSPWFTDLWSSVEAAGRTGTR